ncbi:MAG: hypothetical protein JO151_07835 [Verrucomicrobia bacterium]|nr:hypothetical protein [Verrucomicrobiota bacterium]
MSFFPKTEPLRIQNGLKISPQEPKIINAMGKRVEERRHGGKHSRRGSWAKSLRDSYADEARAVGMPIDQFLDLIADRLEKHGQRPKGFRRMSRAQRWRERPFYPSPWLDE